VNDDITRVTWRKSTRSNGSGNCVEIAELAESVAVRDSKHPTGPTLRFARAEWQAFIDGAKDGQFDPA
jgi:hypothetical protein